MKTQQDILHGRSLEDVPKQRVPTKNRTLPLTSAP